MCSSSTTLTFTSCCTKGFVTWAAQHVTLLGHPDGISFFAISEMVKASMLLAHAVWAMTCCYK